MIESARGLLSPFKTFYRMIFRLILEVISLAFLHYKSLILTSQSSFFDFTEFLF